MGTAHPHLSYPFLPAKILYSTAAAMAAHNINAGQVFSITQAFFRYSLLAYLLEHDDQSQTIGEMFRQREEETGKLTFLERLWQYLATFLKTVLNTLAHFCDPGPQFRAYLDAITNTFNQFSPLKGWET